MITKRKSLKLFLEEDRKALQIKRKYPPIFGMETWKFQIARRNYEYCLNTHKNTGDGSIIINPKARIGKYCNIQQCINIGKNYDSERVPVIRDNVYIGPDAKIFGKITIADGTAIGAGAIVNKTKEKKIKSLWSIQHILQEL